MGCSFLMVVFANTIIPEAPLCHSFISTIVALRLYIRPTIVALRLYIRRAKNDSEIRRLLRLSLAILAGIGLFSFAAAQIFAAPIIRLFLPQGGAVYALTLSGLLLFSWSFLLSGFNMFASSFFTALSDGKTSALLSFARDLVGISIFLLVLPHFFGLTGAWLAVPAADIAADIAAAILSATLLIGAARRSAQKAVSRQVAEPSQNG